MSEFVDSKVMLIYEFRMGTHGQPGICDRDGQHGSLFDIAIGIYL